MPALGCEHVLVIMHSTTGRDESKNECVEKASAEWPSNPAEKCSKDQSFMVGFRPGTSKTGMDDGEKWLISLRERFVPASTLVQDIWTSQVEGK